MLAVAHPGLGIGKVHRFLGPGDGHIEQPSLLFQFGRSQHHAPGREEVFLHARHKDIREFQTLGGMDGHQGYLVGSIFFVVFRKIHVAQQGDIFQEDIQRNHRQILVAYLRHVFIGKHLLADFLASVLHEHRHTVQQFLHVGGAGLSFDGRVGLERGQEGGLVRQPARQHIGRVRFYPLRSGIDHRAECLQVFYSRVFQPEGLQTVVIDRFK